MLDRLLTYLGKVPAGLMLIPLFLGALVNTFCPSVLEIGSFTTAVFSNSGAAAFMGLQMVCLGARLEWKTLPRAFATSSAILIARFLSGMVMVWLFQLVLQTDVLWGICVLAVATAISNTNGSIYLALCNMTDEPSGAVGASILALNNGPMFPLLMLGMAGYVSVSPMDAVALLIPMVLGMILSNLSLKVRDFLDGGVTLMLPFIGFSLGAGIDLKQALTAGSTGILLATFVIVAGGAVLFWVDKYLCRGKGTTGLAAAATGANAVAVPAAVALIDPAWEPYVAAATAQIATCVVLSAIFVPMITLSIHKRQKNLQ